MLESPCTPNAACLPDGRQQRRQLELTTRLNALHRERHASQGELDARINSFETAFRMQGMAPDLFDLNRESASVYSLDLTKRELT